MAQQIVLAIVPETCFDRYQSFFVLPAFSFSWLSDLDILHNSKNKFLSHPDFLVLIWKKLVPPQNREDTNRNRQIWKKISVDVYIWGNNLCDCLLN